jgi:hypothetical protein
LGIIQEILIEPTHPTNIEVDIKYPAVGLRCGIQTMHLSSIKSRVIPLTYIPNGNFTGDLNRVHPSISKLYPVKFLTAKFLSTGFKSINLFSVQG